MAAERRPKTAASTYSEQRLKRHVFALQLMDRHRRNITLRKSVLAHSENGLICSLCDCAYNILRGNVKVSPKQKRVLTKYRDHLRKLVDKRIPVKRKRAILQTGSGGFLTALLAPLASTVLLPLLKQVIGGN